MLNGRAEPPGLLVVGGTPFFGPTSCTQKEMARAWRRAGARVLYLELGGDPRPYRARVAQAGAEPVEAAPGLWVLRLEPWLGLPWSYPDLLRRRNLQRNLPRVLQALDKAGLRSRPFVAVHYGWFWAEWIGHLGAAWDVYDCTDEHRASAPVEGRPRLERHVWRCELEMIARAGLVVAVSQVLLQERAPAAKRTLCLPNAVEPLIWAPRPGEAPGEPPDLAGLPSPRLALIGNLQPKLDLDLVWTLAAAHPHWGFVLIGPLEKGVRLPAAPANLRWLGVKPQDELRAYLAHAHAGLLPLRAGRFNEASCPLKLLEYLAAGLPVAASRIPAVEELARRLPALVHIAAGPEQFGAACQGALKARARSSASDIAAAVQGSTWSARVEALLQALR